VGQTLPAWFAENINQFSIQLAICHIHRGSVRGCILCQTELLLGVGPWISCLALLQSMHILLMNSSSFSIASPEALSP
jgi:hypothetical protein